MATISSEHIQEQPPTDLTTHRRAAPWGYFFYCELMKIFRNPPAVVFGIGFPTFFFLIFGNTFSAAYSPTILASYAAYGAFIVAFQTFSISLATERSLGWNKLLRTTPMSSALYLGSKFCDHHHRGHLPVVAFRRRGPQWENTHEPGGPGPVTWNDGWSG